MDVRAITSLDELEEITGVYIGDLVLCSYYPHNTPPGTQLELLSGLYMPFQALKTDYDKDAVSRLKGGAVNLADGVKQDNIFARNKRCIRLGFVSYAQDHYWRLTNEDGFQKQLLIENIVDFRILMKSKELTKFLKKSFEKYNFK